MSQAKEGLRKLHEQVDSLIVIPNEQLFKNIDKNLTVKESFRKADEVLCQGVEGISNIITNPGDVNTDFADVRNAMSGQGNAIFGIGIGEGENRATDAAYNAINNPMLENSKIDGAKNLLINICASEEIRLSEVGEICKIVTASADPNYNMYWGQVTQPELGDKISVTVIATGFEANKNENQVQAEKEVEQVVEQPKVLPENVVSTSELDMLLHRNNSPARPAAAFTTRREAEPVHTVEKEKAGSLSAGLFDDQPSQGSFVSKKTYTQPPAGFNPDSNDLSQPAIWRKTSEFSKGINLSDN